MKNLVHYCDLERMAYADAWELQKTIHQEIYHRNLQSTILFVEHPPTITLGRSSDRKNLLLNSNELKEKSVDLFEIDRGGDVTYHGPGQIVIYPILDLSLFKKDLHWYLRRLEDCVIELCANFDLRGERIDGLTGVWVNNEKLCAIGVKVSRWVSMHGLAINLTTHLPYFNYIVPCGISNKAVTSLEKLGIESIEWKKIIELFLDSFQNVFNMELKPLDKSNLLKLIIHEKTHIS